VGRLAILRLPNARDCGGLDTRRFLAGNEAGLACFRSLNVGRYVCHLGQPALRSQITPVWLVHPDGSACGLLEDTRKAKRLISDDGQELLSAHLSCFAYNSVSAAAELLRVALIEAARSNLPALFVAVPDAEVAALCRSVPSLNILTAPATVYGAGLPPGLWNINSSEI
jgi:hypothetical protein